MSYQTSKRGKIAQAQQKHQAQKNSSIVRKIFAKVRKTRKELPLVVVTKRFSRLCEKIACKANFKQKENLC